MKKIIAATIVLTLGGIGLALAKVQTDYDKTADFRAFKTYSWLKVDAGNSLWTDRIRRDVDQQMSSKGLSMQQSGGDIDIAAIGRVTQQQSYTTFYDGLGGGWGWRGFGDTGFSTTTPEETPVGSLTLDMFNGQTKSSSGGPWRPRHSRTSRTRTRRSSSPQWKTSSRSSLRKANKLHE